MAQFRCTTFLGLRDSHLASNKQGEGSEGEGVGDKGQEEGGSVSQDKRLKSVHNMTLDIDAMQCLTNDSTDVTKR